MSLVRWFGVHSRGICLTAWLVYVATACMVAIKIDAPVVSDSKYYLDIAASIADGNGAMEKHLFAYRPPGFPAWIALPMWLGLRQIIALKLLMVLTMSTAVPLAWLLGGQMLGRAVAPFAALLVACSPWFICLPDSMLSEGLYIPLLLLLAWLLVMAFERSSLRLFAVAGVVCGIAALVREQAFYCPLLLLGTLVVAKIGAGWPRRVLVALVFTVCEMGAITPWVIRNYSVFHRMVPITTNSWINLYIGNNSRFASITEFHWTIPAGLSWNQRPQPEGGDEIAAMDACKRESLRYIKDAPLAFLRRGAAKIWRFLTPHFGLVSKQRSPILAVAVLLDLILYCVVISGALFFMIRRRRKLIANPGLLFCLGYGAMVVVIAGMTFSNSRYRLPMVTLLIPISSAGIVMILDRLPRGAYPPHGSRLALGRQLQIPRKSPQIPHPQIPHANPSPANPSPRLILSSCKSKSL